MTAGPLTGIRTVFPNCGGRPAIAEPLIGEARDRQRRRRRWTALLVIVVLVGVWLISSDVGRHSALRDASTASAAAPPKPCALLSNAQVANVLGAKINLRTPTTNACIWQTVPIGAYTYNTRQLDVSFQRVTPARARYIVKQGHYVPVKVRGQNAWATPDSNGSFDLMFVRKGYVIFISTSGTASGTQSPLAAEKALAPLILKRF